MNTAPDPSTPPERTPDELLDQAVNVFAALAQRTRLSIVRELVRRHDPSSFGGGSASGVSAGEIASALGVAPASLSFHLKELLTAGVIARTREGRHLNYRLNEATLSTVVATLLEDCCGGRCGELTLNDACCTA